MINNSWLTPRRRANLERLADYLESLPRSYKHFDMATFVFHGGECGLDGFKNEEAAVVADPKAFLNNCGAVACAVGHGPAAGIPLSKSHIEKSYYGDTGIDWEAYSHRNFIPSTKATGFGDLWDWCFGGSWDNIDNHHYGAAARIRFLLAGERIPGKTDRWGSFEATLPKRAHKKLYAPFHIDNRVPTPVTA